MRDAWGKFGAGCLGAIVGFSICVALYLDESDDRLAEKITDRMQRTLDFHFDGWRKRIEEERTP